MVPEAGGSSSFGRRAFNEFVSFGAGWALMLDYIVTVAISAYFVPNYLAVFWPALKTQPYNSIGGIVTIIALVGINVVGIKEAARLNIVLALLDLGTQVLLMVMGVVLLLEPKMLIDQVHLGRRAHLGPPHLRHLDRHHRLHGHRDGLQHVRGGGEPGPGRAAGHQLRAHRRPRRLPRHLDDGALGDAGQAQRARRRRQDRPDGAGRGRGQEQGRAQRAVRLQGHSAAGQRRQGRLHPGGAAGGQDLDHPGAEAGGGDLHAGRQDVHQALRLAARQRLQGRPRGGHRPLPARRPRLAEDHPHALGRHPGRDDPAHRHERRPDRRVAPGVLPRSAPSGAADPRPRASQAADALRGDHRLRRRSPASCCSYRATPSTCSPTCTPSAP